MGISAAFVGGMITSKLRLSPIVGYLLAGIIIGPHTPGFVGDSILPAQHAHVFAAVAHNQAEGNPRRAVIGHAGIQRLHHRIHPFEGRVKHPATSLVLRQLVGMAGEIPSRAATNDIQVTRRRAPDPQIPAIASLVVLVRRIIAGTLLFCGCCKTDTLKLRCN